ncbi:MAG: phage adaptor protein [Planctomycetota bacterium]|jgi:hypothetical protein
MNAADVLSVVKDRIEGGVGVLNIDAELAGVLLDISSRAEFLTDTAVIETVAETSDYDQPADMKSIYEVAVGGSALLDKITYRQYLEFVEQATITAGVPTKYALRHGKLWLWPVPDAEYSVTVDFSMYHPGTFTDILFAPEFNEAIYHGVLKALYEGQFKRLLKLSEQTFADDETLKLKFYEQFPQAKLHAKQYENEIAKLISNLEVDTETVLVEYRDI